ncbi:hydrogenase expression/formation protein HypE [Bdellovibrionota bacterium FG-1]
MNNDQPTVTLAHGNGGKLTHELISKVFLPAFDSPELREMADSACLAPFGAQDRLVFTTDSHVVTPLFFPGGDIGKLSVTGTLNDLAVMGARPLYLSVGFIIEEGFPLSELKRVVASMAQAAQEGGVRIVTGDTKVVEKGAADGLFINTSGIGVLLEGSPHLKTKPPIFEEGDAVILSGSLGDHGIAVYSKRKGIDFKTDLQSDCAQVFPLVKAALAVCPDIRNMRDPTRGGLATTLNEFVVGQVGQPVGLELFEAKIPLKNEVKGACELLGFDPLYLANEGKLVLVVPEAYATRVCDALKEFPIGRETSIVGRITQQTPGKVLLRTQVGGSRILDMLSGEMLPRIC